jgi:hypothetical protein
LCEEKQNVAESKLIAVEQHATKREEEIVEAIKVKKI